MTVEKKSKPQIRKPSEDTSYPRSVATGLDMTWTPPEPSRASRKINVRNKVSYRGSIIDHVRNRQFVYESKLERDFLEIVLADEDVVDVHEQPPAVAYVDANGRAAHHVFDMHVVLRDGRRIAVDVKPRSKVERSGILETQALIREQVGAEFADLYVVRTEDHLHPDDVLDARLISRARRFADPEADAAMAAFVGRLHGWCRLGDLVEAAGTGAAAFNGGVRLIGTKVLEVRDQTRISLDCLVRRARV